MINFWLFCLILLLVASLFLIIPSVRYFRKARSESSVIELSEEQRRKENVLIFKERVQELEQDKTSGNLSEENYLQMRAELEAALLNDIPDAGLADSQQRKISEHTHSPTHYAFLGLGLVFIFAFSLWFYQINGAKEKVDQYHAQNFSAAELEQAKEMARQGDMNALLEQLYNKLKQSPDNIEGWQLLARSAMNSERFDYAVEAYQEIIRIVTDMGENPAAFYGLLAQARYYQTDGHINAEIDGLLKKALSLDSDELNSLGLLAIDAFTKQRYQEAKELWVRVLEIYPEHPAKSSIEAGIARANAQLGISSESGIPSNSARDQMAQVEQNADVSENAQFVNVDVSIDESIASNVSADNTVFIIARNARPQSGQPNVPLAVSRHKVSDLPLKVRLDDAKAMSPMARLSSAEQVTVIARISASGSPMPQPGDYEAVSADIKPGEQALIELVIQNQLK
jgi:cytochrome c-type biogenesis protein CcmH